MLVWQITHLIRETKLRLFTGTRDNLINILSLDTPDKHLFVTRQKCEKRDEKLHVIAPHSMHHCWHTHTYTDLSFTKETRATSLRFEFARNFRNARARKAFKSIRNLAGDISMTVKNEKTRSPKKRKTHNTLRDDQTIFSRDRIHSILRAGFHLTLIFRR